MDLRQSPNRRVVELQEENETLKSKIAELSEQLNNTKTELSGVKEELSDVKERLTFSDQVTIATQRRELQQAGIYEDLLAQNVYEKLRPELQGDHLYAKLQPSSLCRYSSVYDDCFISLMTIVDFHSKF